MWTQFRWREESLLMHRDAATFVDRHFPFEASRLRDDLSKYNLLERAVDFSFDIYRVGDIKEQCFHIWIVFIYYLLRYGAMHQSLVTIKHRLWRRGPPDIRLLLSRPQHFMISFLKSNYRAKRLYRASIDGAYLGLRASWYMEWSRKKIFVRVICAKCWVPWEYWNPHRHSSPNSVLSSSGSWSCGSH